MISVVVHESSLELLNARASGRLLLKRGIQNISRPPGEAHHSIEAVEVLAENGELARDIVIFIFGPLETHNGARGYFRMAMQKQWVTAGTMTGNLTRSWRDPGFRVRQPIPNDSNGYIECT